MAHKTSLHCSHMSFRASQITHNLTVCLTACSCWYQRKYQSLGLLALYEVKLSDSRGFIRGKYAEKVHSFWWNYVYNSPIPFRVVSLMPGQSRYCPSASEMALKCRGMINYSERPRGAGFRSVNSTESCCENPERVLARAGFSQHLECGIHGSESSLKGPFTLIPHPVARWAKTTP